MSALTRYAQKALLDHLMGKSAYTMPTTYLALFSADPGEDGAQTGEPSGNGYARLALTANMGLTSLVTGQAVNEVLMQFAEATADWGDAVTHFGIMDASAIGAGNMLMRGALASALIVSTGDELPISEGSLVLGLA